MIETINYTSLISNNTNIIKEVLFMPYNLETFSFMVMSLIMAWLFHEVMHYTKANQYKLKPIYGWDNKGSFVTITKKPSPEQDRIITETGIIMGSLPIIITTLIIGLWTIIPLTIYILGCHTDIKKLIKKVK
jgi:hypothetical protein